jgi:hypothetical protein
MSLSAMTTPSTSFIEFMVMARDLTQPVTTGSLPVWSARLSRTLEIILELSFRDFKWGHSLTSILALLAIDKSSAEFFRLVELLRFLVLLPCCALEFDEEASISLELSQKPGEF